MSDFEILSTVLTVIGMIVSVFIAWIKDISSRKK